MKVSQHSQILLRLIIISALLSPGVWGDTSGPVFLKDCDTCPELVQVGPGEFSMGSRDDEVIGPGYPPARIEQEKPVHLVRINAPFAIGRYEITIGQFAEFAEDTGFQAAGCFVLTGDRWVMNAAASWREPGFAVTDASPATCLSYDDFAAYLAWLSARTGATYRFPTEAEWEFVARTGLGGRPAPDSLGPSACQYLNGSDSTFTKVFTAQWKPGLFPCDDGVAAAAAVGRFPANDLGMYDVFGNMSEYTADCAGASYEGGPVDGSPRVLEPCAARVLRGGSWAGGPGYLRPATRGSFPVTLRGDGHGLRVVRELAKGP